MKSLLREFQTVVLITAIVGCIPCGIWILITAFIKRWKRFGALIGKMRLSLLILLGSLLSSAGQHPSPQTAVPRTDLTLAFNGLWFNPRAGCDKLNYHLFSYTEKHPDRVTFTGEDEVANIKGFVDHLAAISPIIVLDHVGTPFSLLFFNGKILTPWGDEIIFVVDRNKDGYLSAFGEKRSVNHYADPWKLEGFSYTKAVGITILKKPGFFQQGSSSIVPLNDNEYTRLKDLVPMPKLQADESVASQPSVAVADADLEGPHKAASLFFAACRSEDLSALENLITKRQLESIRRKNHTLAWLAGGWATYRIDSIDGSDPITKTPDGRTTTMVNFTVITADGKKPAKVTFALEGNEWKMDEN
jgi:hypothetical protein